MEMELFQGRRSKLQAALKEQGVKAAVLSDCLDQYYFSGTMQSNYLVIPAEGKAFHLTRKAVDRIGRESPGLTVETFRSTREILEAMARQGVDGLGKWGLNTEMTSMSNFFRWQKMLPKVVWEDVGEAIRDLRMVKDQTEQDCQRRAGEGLRALPDWVEAALREGQRTELEIAALLEYRLRLAGHSGIIRLSRGDMESGVGLVVAGVNSLTGSRFEGVCAGAGLNPAYPYGPSGRTMLPGEPITLDYVMNDQGYQVDMTRMISFGEEPHPLALRAYDDMMAILEILEKALKPGAKPSDLYALSAAEADRRGWSESFMGHGTEKVYFVGHGIGLTLDEAPYLAPKMDAPLREGMVVAMEPKVMIPEIGVVGIEDTYIIGPDGAHRITNADRAWRVVK
jgi:Xaa-Pro aminopeptidase